ncbi:MAG: hypothetical protein DRQ39_02710 [Gammaproteobacteria bacterium]|nr:MAG: hypothetical protein DRQ39_02710 [Gammaproteobacteria bacterium]
MSNTTSIYAKSYTMEPVDKKEILEELRGQKAHENRARKLGILLKEEKTTNQTLKRKVRTLEAETRQLKEVIAQHLREEQSRRSRKGEPR